MTSFTPLTFALAGALAIALNIAPACAQAPASPPMSAPTSAPTPAPTSAPTSPATSASAAELTEDGKPKAKMVRAQCRTEAEGQGLKGADKHKAISACVVRQRPDLAAKEQCRADGRAKGLKKDGLKAFVTDCAKAKG